jgi:hypothetical protein
LFYREVLNVVYCVPVEQPTLQEHIDQLSGNPDLILLRFLFSVDQHPTQPINIPDKFESLEFRTCNNVEVSLDVNATYCGYKIYDFHMSTSEQFQAYSLTLGSGVSFSVSSDFIRAADLNQDEKMSEGMDIFPVAAPLGLELFVLLKGVSFKRYGIKVVGFITKHPVEAGALALCAVGYYYITWGKVFEALKRGCRHLREFLKKRKNPLVIHSNKW